MYVQRNGLGWFQQMTGLQIHSWAESIQHHAPHTGASVCPARTVVIWGGEPDAIGACFAPNDIVEVGLALRVGKRWTTVLVGESTAELPYDLCGSVFDGRVAFTEMKHGMRSPALYTEGALMQLEAAAALLANPLFVPVIYSDFTIGAYLPRL